MWLSSGVSLVGTGPFVRIDTGTGPGRFGRAESGFRAHFARADVADEVDEPGTGPLCFGSWTFDENRPGSVVLVPSVVYGASESAAWETRIDCAGSPAFDPSSVPPPGAQGGLEDWISRFERVYEQIKQGRVQKVVLARAIRAAAGADRPEVLRRLAVRYPGCFTFACRGLVGASPELLVRRVGTVVDSIPIAGSAPRGTDEQADEEIGRQLWASEKNRLEHRLTVESVIDALRPCCAELEAEAEPSLLLLENLQHLSTKVQGRLEGTPSSLQLAGMLHPTAAVCGTPRAGALNLIRSVEGFDRGRYAGPVGWMDRQGDGEWAIALRCADLSVDPPLVYAGAGIVEGSSAEEEFEETELKLQAMVSALGAGPL
ncbi:MAG: isochorismate synthase [Actinomycetota bacterium]